MEININPNNLDLQKMLETAMFESLDETKKDLLIKSALTHLTEVPKWKDQTPLQEMFYQCVYEEAQNTVKNLLADNPQIQSSIAALVENLIKEMIAKHTPVFIDGLAEVIGQSLTNKLRIAKCELEKELED
jgi:hypothetical protein